VRPDAGGVNEVSLYDYSIRDAGNPLALGAGVNEAVDGRLEIRIKATADPGKLREITSAVGSSRPAFVRAGLPGYCSEHWWMP
jgi:hypothetical protein